jgi:diguanylate cyclase (GGDEF)-like protein
VAQTSLSLAAYGVLALLLLGQWLMGLADARRLGPLVTFGLGGACVFVLLMRTGLNLRLHTRWGCDAGLSLPQALWGVVTCVWGYAVMGPSRGAVLVLLVLVAVAAMFKLRLRESVGLSVLTLTLLGAVMCLMKLNDPARFDGSTEWSNLSFTAAALAGVALLAVCIGRLRDRLTRQHLELVHALERISELATRDELTSMPNRRAMQEMLIVETARQARLDLPLSIALIDLDHFKSINDQHGHAGGDAVLRGFARQIESELRGADIMGRWGGEEFLLMLPDTTLEHALQCVERLRARVQSATFDDVAAGLTLTFSAGITACMGQGDINTAIDRADKAMYRAKAAGRSRSEVA